MVVEFYFWCRRDDRLLFMSMVKDVLFGKTSEQLYAAKNRIDHNEKVQQHMQVI